MDHQCKWWWSSSLRLIKKNTKQSLSEVFTIPVICVKRTNIGRTGHARCPLAFRWKLGWVGLSWATYRQKAEAQHVIDTQSLQLQDHWCKIGALHLWHCGWRKLLVVLLWNTNTRGHIVERWKQIPWWHPFWNVQTRTSFSMHSVFNVRIRTYQCKAGSISLGGCARLDQPSGRLRPWRWGSPRATQCLCGDCRPSVSQMHSQWQTQSRWWWWRSQQYLLPQPPEEKKIIWLSFSEAIIWFWLENSTVNSIYSVGVTITNIFYSFIKSSSNTVFFQF